MIKLLTGNEAVVYGALEAGITYACAYPGTPSTEILENMADLKEITAEWAPNEKVALESAYGAAVAGARALASMKMVGVNVAADPLFSLAYSGINGGLMLVSADDPGLHSSQNEQDNRWYAKFAKVAMLEPSSSQESKDMVRVAMEVSEEFDTCVLFRMTTRVCHSKSLVNVEEVAFEGKKKPYVKNLAKYDLVPANSRKLHYVLEDKLLKLEEYSNNTPLNFIEWNDKKIGVITSGISYQYAQEVFGDTVSYLKLGFTYPLPMDKIKAFAKEVGTVYVIEENEPYIEEQLKANGVACIGREKLPKCGELSPDIIAGAFLEEKPAVIEYDANTVVARPPTLCAGCPHRGFFFELAKRKDVMITGDIGCYSLGGSDPLNAKDTTLCMGGGISMGHGAQRAFDKFGENKRTISVIGDSTFFHSGMTSLLHIAYNRSNSITCILDNRITGMTGHQENPGSGFTLQGMPTRIVEIEPLVRALGIENIKTVNPINLQEMKEAFDWAIALDEPSVIITRWPCILKKLSQADKQEFGDYVHKCKVDAEKCTGCKMCIRTGCPALRFNKEIKKVVIDDTQCVGCEVCLQTCKFKAIERVGAK